MEIGDYVRTDTGIIQKIGKIYEENEKDKIIIEKVYEWATEKENQQHKWNNGLANYNRDERGRFI